MTISFDSREGRVLRANEYIREAGIIWRSIPWDASTMTMPNAVNAAHAVELVVKAGVLYGNETPAADHGLDALWSRVQLDPAEATRYRPLIAQAAVIRQDGGYPGSAGYEALTKRMDQSSWSAFHSDGEGLFTVIQGVGQFLTGEAPRPPAWRGPGPPRSR